ncbi:MAG: ATP-binding protein [Thermomicrobiales bacterium]
MDGNGATSDTIQNVPAEARARVGESIAQAGGLWDVPEDERGAVGKTMFDGPASEDNSITVLIPRDSLEQLPSQALARIVSKPDGREYLGIVVAGPFAEPDGLRADAPIVVTTTVHGGIFMPRYHGRVQIELLGERVDGVLQPPRFRPLPNSPVFRLDEKETAAVLRVSGDIRVGLAVGHQGVEVCVPSTNKSVLPRHTGIIGTTGGGKSTTVAGFIAEAQKAGLAIVLLDVEGEYTFLNEPSDDPRMASLLSQRGSRPMGVSDTTLYYLFGRETANPRHPHCVPFTLRFSDLSPYAVGEILDFSDAQHERFWIAYELTKTLLRRFGVTSVDDTDIDEFEGGFPGMRLEHLLDTVSGCLEHIQKGEPTFRGSEFQQRASEVTREIQSMKNLPAFPASWRALLGRLARFQRLGVFDNSRARPIEPKRLLEPGGVSIVDLSDTESPDLNNLVITAILRGVQRGQEELYAAAERQEDAVPRTLVIIEEAHEFLAKERIDKMPHLFAQVARIAKRGRKRWLGLVFVTQLPAHLPTQVIGLVNNWIVHKIGDAGVISTLKHSVSGIDESLWTRLPGLAPGQAVVSFTHMQRPVLTSINPTPAKLRLVD